jgi:hypothetical protein
VSEPPNPAEPEPARDGGYQPYFPPGKAPITPWDPKQGPEPSSGQTLGQRAFGLSLAPFLVTNLVSLVLAGLALSRSRRGGDHGTGFAIIAIAIDALVVAAWALVLLALLR